jgi:hypothetical protein
MATLKVNRLRQNIYDYNSYRFDATTHDVAHGQYLAHGRWGWTLACAPDEVGGEGVS